MNTGVRWYSCRKTIPRRVLLVEQEGGSVLLNHLVIILFVFLFTAFDYPWGIFKLLLYAGFLACWWSPLWLFSKMPSVVIFLSPPLRQLMCNTRNCFNNHFYLHRRLYLTNKWLYIRLSIGKLNTLPKWFYCRHHW